MLSGETAANGLAMFSQCKSLAALGPTVLFLSLATFVLKISALERSTIRTAGTIPGSDTAEQNHVARTTLPEVTHALTMGQMQRMKN